MRALKAITLAIALTGCNITGQQTVDSSRRTVNNSRLTINGSQNANAIQQSRIHEPSEYYYEGWLRTRNNNSIDYAIFQQAPETGGYILELQPARSHEDSTIYELSERLEVQRVIYRNGGVAMRIIMGQEELIRVQRTVEETLQQIIDAKTENKQ